MYLQKLTTTFAFTFLFLAVFGRASGQVAEQQVPIHRIEALLGPQLAIAEQYFSVGENHVAKITFDSGGMFKIVIVFPKYYLDRCDQSSSEPTSIPRLTNDQYQGILAKVEQLQTFGKLIYGGKYGIVTNLKASRIDQYQRAVVWRSAILTSDEHRRSYDLIDTFFIYYFGNIQGFVEAKQNAIGLGNDNIYKIKIDGAWYFATQRESKSVVQGSRATILAAGPITTNVECPCGR